MIVSVLLVAALLNLNAATIEELDRLPGVGPVLAKRIVDFRNSKGGFRRVEELLAVPGISERKWRVLRELVTVESDSGR
jgi:competence protein ComEA